MAKAADIRLFVSDIDGTLVRRDKSVSEANVAAIRRLVDSGIAVSLISARPMSGIAWIGEKLGLPGPFGAFNGGTLFGANGIVGTPARLEPEIARNLVTTLDGEQIDVWLFANGQWHVRHTDNPHIAREILSAGVDPTIEADLSLLCDVADKIVGVSDDAALLKRVEETAVAETRSRATVALSQPYFLDATALLANKGDGVARIAEIMGVSLDQVAVIGDMPNDLPMFARAGLSIAMGQAPDHVRAAADWVTGSNEEDGVAQAIARLLAER